jgi:chorismate--pyruvate lyase
VLPSVSLRGAWCGLGKLGNRPLGASLFANPRVKRTPLEYKKLPRQHPISMRVAAHMQTSPKALWARRSIFSLNNAKILVTEVFLEQLLTPVIPAKAGMTEFDRLDVSNNH